MFKPVSVARKISPSPYNIEGARAHSNTILKFCSVNVGETCSQWKACGKVFLRLRRSVICDLVHLDTRFPFLQTARPRLQPSSPDQIQGNWAPFSLGLRFALFSNTTPICAAVDWRAPLTTVSAFCLASKVPTRNDVNQQRCQVVTRQGTRSSSPWPEHDSLEEGEDASKRSTSQSLNPPLHAPRQHDARICRLPVRGRKLRET